MKYTNKDIEIRLKEETKNITPDVLLRAKYANIEELEYDNVKFKRSPVRLIVTFLTSFVLIFVMTNIVIYSQVYETISVDINPSVEFEVNRFGRVIDVEYNNTDAYNIFSDIKLKNLKIENALEVSYDRLYDKGFLNNEENMIIVSGYKKNKGLSEDRLLKLTNIIKEKSIEKKVNVVVEVNVVTKEDKEEAKENDVSLGKLKVIKMILEESSEYTFEELKALSMKDLKQIIFDLRRKR